MWVRDGDLWAVETWLSRAVTATTIGEVLAE
jgi:hypothetical protein